MNRKINRRNSSLRKKPKIKLILFLFIAVIVVGIGQKYFSLEEIFKTQEPENSSGADFSFLSPVGDFFPSESPADLFQKEGIELTGSPVEEENALVATLSSGTILLFKKGEKIEQKLPSLQLILKNIKMEGKWPVKIDLRYSRPVIGY